MPSLKLSPTAPQPVQLTNLIAVVGCDGSGKSTLTEDLRAHFDGIGRIEILYLGQSSGNIGGWIKRLPLVGAPLGRYLARKAARAHHRTGQAPDTATTLAIFLLSLWRAYKFHRMLTMCSNGVVVITDRYPQAEVPGFYFDGPGLGAVKTGNWLARKLVANEFRLYLWMAKHKPTLLIRLNVDAETAHARKPDHKLTMLQEKVAVIPNLHFNGARILDLDGRAPYEQVLTTALQAIGNTIKTPPA